MCWLSRSELHTPKLIKWTRGFHSYSRGQTRPICAGTGFVICFFQWDGEDERPVKITRTLAIVNQGISTKHRFNGGNADSRGRIFAGSKNYQITPGEFEQKQCSLYGLDKTEVKKFCGDTTISNGLAWDLSKKVFYYIDSVDENIRSYYYDVESGDISNMKFIFDLRTNGYTFSATINCQSEQRFTSYEHTKNWVDSWIVSKDKKIFRRGIRMLPERWENVVGSDGLYFK